METQVKTEIDDHPAIDELSKEIEALEDAVNYKLSDAIREGSSCTEQAVGAYRQGDNVCAMSAAAIAIKARFGA